MLLGRPPMASTASSRLTTLLAMATFALTGCSASTSHTTSLAELQREGAKVEFSWTAGSLIVRFTGMPSRSNDCLVLDPSQLTVRIDGATTTPSTGPRSTGASVQPLGGSIYLPPPTAGCQTPSVIYDLSAAVALVPHAGVVDILLADGSATAHFQVDGLATPLALAPARPGPFKRGAQLTLSLTPASATIQAGPFGWRRGAASTLTCTIHPVAEVSRTLASCRRCRDTRSARRASARGSFTACTPGRVDESGTRLGWAGGEVGAGIGRVASSSDAASVRTSRSTRKHVRVTANQVEEIDISGTVDRRSRSSVPSRPRLRRAGAEGAQSLRPRAAW